MSDNPEAGRRDRLTRRVFLGGSALVGVGAAGGAVGTALSTREADASDLHGAPVPFYGVHQAGIDTAAQDRLAFAAFDLMTDKTSDVQELLREWTKASIAMCAGSMVPGSSTQQDAPPADTGEAQDLPPSKLTITAGLGPSLFDRRFGLASRKPAALQNIPPLPRDDLVIT